MPKKKKANKRSYKALLRLVVVVCAFAAVGLIALRMTSAQDKVIAPSSNPTEVSRQNEAAFKAIQANANQEGHPFKPKLNIADEPRDLRSKSVAPLNRPLSTGEKPPAISEQTRTEATHLSTTQGLNNWGRAYAVAHAQSFIGWQGQHFFYWGVFPNEEWCADFASYIFNLAGARFWWGKGGWRDPLVQNIATGMYASGRLRQVGYYTPKPGDVVFFNWNHVPGSWNHIGIVESFDSKSGRLITIEGNVGADDNRYSSVQRKQRSWSTVVAFGNQFNDSLY